MSSFIKNITLILAFVVLMPISIFIIMEIGSLNESEETLEDAYREQLDAIIFSVNQYSGDVFDFYLRQIDFSWNKTNEQSALDSTFLQQNLAIDAIVVKVNNQLLNYKLDSSLAVNSDLADSLFTSNSAVIERLIRYKETGYIKPELIGQIQINESWSNVTLIVLGNSTPCLVFLNPVLFVEDLLAPKIQQIAGEELNIVVTFEPSNTIVYGEEIPETNISQTGQLTLLENFTISVSLANQSLKNTIEYRTNRNILVLIIMISLVIIGIILVFRNLKKEMMLSKAKSDFVANVSHEIRTPLALISMFNETLLLDRVRDENKKKEYFEIIDKEASRLTNIVNKILSFSQIEASKKEYHFEDINPNTIIRETIDSYSYHLNDKGFDYTLDLKGDGLIRADKESLVEVIINLLDNAIKYSLDSKELHIRSMLSDNAFTIDVEDKGIGISKKDQRHIFDKFYRVNNDNLHNTKGTGLGLSLVYQIMNAHKGFVSLKSELNKGSTFILKFPLNNE